MYRMFKTNRFLKLFFPKYIWELPNSEKKIYLTFDDGPIPEITEWVLGLLKKENIKATFFCIGENIQKHPEVFKQIISENHTIGNHTFNHLKGWNTSTKKYLENVELCNLVFEKYSISNFQSKLFRPPYGKITPWQAYRFRKLDYKIIMWDILSGDFDTTITPEKCLKNVLEKTTNGSIVVMHDSEKAKDKIFYTLPKILSYYKEKGYLFKAIS